MVLAWADKFLYLWDLPSSQHSATEAGKPAAVMVGHNGDVLDCLLMESEFKAVSVSADHTLRVWDLRTGAEILSARQHLDAELPDKNANVKVDIIQPDFQYGWRLYQQLASMGLG